MIVNPSVTTLKYKAKEEDIDINLLTDFHLCLSISSNELSVVVINTKNGKCLLGEKYEFESSQNANGLVNCLAEVYDDHHLLKAGFWGKITISIVNNNFTFIPNSLFEEKNPEKVNNQNRLRKNYPLPP